MSHLEHIPFQTIVYYTRPNGMKCMRVMTELQEITEKRNEAEKDVKLEVLAVNAA